ncbi:hypothetical protein [Sinomicrobium sp. M5D2P17]
MRNILKKISAYVPSPWGRAWVGVLFLLLPLTFYAQSNLFPTSGNTGIGITTPQTPLQINQSERHKGLSITESDNSLKIYLHLAKFDNGREYGFLDLGGDTKLRGNGELSYFDGNVGIGTTNPGTWKLAVNGKIRAKEIKVETGWSDFVFEEHYALPTLEEVEQHIKEKGHLKDIPSAKEVEANGIFLGEMDAKLLQKIEELTLYMIELKKENQQLRKEMDELKKL